MSQKLYTVPNNSFIRLLTDPVCPPASIQISKSEILWFRHVDGMYSFCRNSDGDIVHPAAWSNVEIVEEPKDAIVYWTGVSQD